MAKTICKYHPRSAARWHCPSCTLDLCAQCVKGGAPPKNAQMCFSCGAEVDSLGVGNTIPPFWERIPQFFIYPARADALMYLGMLSAASLLAFIPLFGILIYLMITYAILKYGYLILNHTARGNLSPPEVLSSGNLAANHNLPLKQSIVFLLMALGVFGVAQLSTPLAFAAILFMMFAMPASTMSMAINGTIWEALNPLMLGGIIKRIGLPYLILYVFLLLVSAGSSAAQLLLEAVLPGWLLIMMITFVSAYFTVTMFNMMGYVVYQYHEALGFDDVREFVEPGKSDPTPAARSSTSAPAAEIDPMEAELNVLINEGKLDEATERMRRRIRGPAGTVDDRERYHKLLVLTKDSAGLSSHGHEYLKVLLHMQQDTKAVQVYEECLALDSGFQLSDGRDTYRLAEVSHGMGKNDLALRMLNKFGQRFVGHAASPNAFLLAAKLLCEHKGEDLQAKRLLDGMLQKYAGHQLASEIRAYRDFVERVSGSGSLAKAS